MIPLIHVILKISCTENLFKYIYIFIHINIVIHKQTVSLYHNSSVWLDT